MSNTQVAIDCVKRLDLIETALRKLRDAAKRYGEAQFFDEGDGPFDEEDEDKTLDSAGAAMIEAIEAADAALGDK